MMHISRKQLLVGAILLALGLILGVSCTGTNDAADIAKIETVWEEYSASVNAGDADRWILLWDENGRQMFPDAPMRIGKDAILAAMEPAFDALDFENFVIDPDEIKILGDEAHSHGTYSYSMTPKAGGDTVEFSGKFSTILEKQADDSWGLLVDCFNSNGPVAGASGETDEDADVAKIEAVWKEYAAAVNADDADRWILLWDENGRQMFPDAPMRVGKDAILAAMEPAFDALDFEEFVINPDEIEILGDKAYSHGTYSYLMTPKAGGDTIEFSGKFLTILAKQDDGSWKLFVDCFNSNAPIE